MINSVTGPHRRRAARLHADARACDGERERHVPQLSRPARAEPRGTRHRPPQGGQGGWHRHLRGRHHLRSGARPGTAAHGLRSLRRQHRQRHWLVAGRAALHPQRVAEPDGAGVRARHRRGVSRHGYQGWRVEVRRRLRGRDARTGDHEPRSGPSAQRNRRSDHGAFLSDRPGGAAADRHLQGGRRRSGTGEDRPLQRHHGHRVPQVDSRPRLLPRPWTATPATW